MYHIKEIYFTLQGEGYHTGRPAVFCRFSGCNLWTGREQDRHKAVCQFCDTDFFGIDGQNGGSYTAAGLAQKCSSLWPSPQSRKFIVCTGGEPALQMDEELISHLHNEGFYIAIETNGTTLLTTGIDWICMSPKAGTKLAVTEGDEIKIVYPQKNLDPVDFEHFDFIHFYIQPMDGDDLAENTSQAIRFCKTNPKWKLSLQTHKLIGIP